MHPDLGAGHAGDLKWPAGEPPRVLHSDLDLAVVELARAQHLAEFLARVGGGTLAHQRVEHALLGGLLGLGLTCLRSFSLAHRDSHLDQIAHDLSTSRPT